MRRRSPRAHAQRQQAPPRAPDLDDAHDFSPPTTTDTAEHHDAAGVRSTTGSRLGVPQQTAPARFMKTPVGFYDRITTDSSLGQTTINLSLRLYTELRRRFTNFYTGYGTPKREALAAAIQTSLRSLDRALDALRKHGGIRTEKLRDGRGHVCGMEIWVLNENSADPDNLTVPTDSQDESKLPPRAVSKNLKKNAKLPPVAVRPAEPNCHREPSLTATGGSAFLSTFQDLSNDQDLDPGDRHDLRTDQDPVVVVKAERQQQHDDDKPPDDDTGPPPDPTVQEALQAFYALWTSLHNRAAYDQRASDERHMAEVVQKAQEADVVVFDLIESYLLWEGDELVVRKHHPLGLLAVNVGRVIAHHRARSAPTLVGRSGIQYPCPHDPPCATTWGCGQRQLQERAGAAAAATRWH